MTENKPCPFCGSYSEELTEHADDCYLIMLVLWALKDIAGLDMTHKGRQYTREEMINAWNTREDRTCKVKASFTNVWGAGYWSKFYELTCGDSFEWNDEKPPNRCPECGAKVVENG